MASIPAWKPLVNPNLLQHPVVQEIFRPDTITAYCRQAGHRWRASVWSPATTLLTFLLQVLDGAKTLRAAVAAVLLHWAQQGRSALPSADPAAYCQARRRLPRAVLERLVAESARRLHTRLPPQDGWHGRRVYVVDGSSVSMPDTPELQAAFPQPAGQQKGCGFPVARLVALFCWSSGALLDLALDALQVHELTLFRRLGERLEAGRLVLADRAYGGYADLACLRARGVDAVVRLHQRRRAAGRQGKRLGPGERLVQWDRPATWRPALGLTRAAFARLPATLTLRLIRVRHAPRGFRSRTIHVVTTLLDPLRFPADELRALYRDRWTAELNLRSLKIGLGMDVLRAQSVDVVRKEILMHLLAYNLIRLLMWQAARAHGRDLHRLSFVGTLHRLRAALPLLLAGGRVVAARLGVQLRRDIAGDLLPRRPDRLEPRRRKRRPKNYSLLVKPRSWYRNHGDPDAR